MSALAALDLPCQFISLNVLVHTYCDSVFNYLDAYSFFLTPCHSLPFSACAVPVGEGKLPKQVPYYLFWKGVSMQGRA